MQLRNISGQASQAVNDRHGAVYWVSSCHACSLLAFPCRFACWSQYDSSFECIICNACSLLALAFAHTHVHAFSYRNHPIHLIHRGDLHARIPYTEQQAANVTKQVIKAISYLHSKSIIHRDIKFENVIFESEHPEAVIKVRCHAGWSVSWLLESVSQQF
jgi:hypothetical protein